jgi:hypothetical protein
MNIFGHQLFFQLIFEPHEKDNAPLGHCSFIGFLRPLDHTLRSGKWKSQMRKIDPVIKIR